MTDDIIMVKHLNIDSAADVYVSRSETGRKAVNQLGKMPLKEIVRQNTATIEKEAIGNALKQTGGNKAKAARILEIDYKTIHTKIKRLGIMTPQGG